ncbi:MAG TPA: DNA internalization-related competence protein ComEC/Rec2 [Candidatus Eisenbacteria bacterium]|nr:DNA internalization-related competence protein ComEC/Rec2 [Candidatus Eisenbacteria bacterium]
MSDALRRRPLYFAALALSAGIGLAGLAPPPAWAGTTAFLSAVLGTFLFLVWQKPRVAAWLAVSALVPLGVILLDNEARLPKDHIAWRAAEEPGEVALGGRIVSEVAERRTAFGARRVSFTMDCSRYWSGGNAADRTTERVRGRVRAYLSSPPSPLAYGDEIVLRGRLELPEGARNPGGFDPRAWLRLDGVRAVVYGGKAPPRVLRHRRGNPAQAAAFGIKRRLSASLDAAFAPREAAFLQALFLGERSGIDEDFKDLFVRTGTLHILSVSGFNIGFLAASLLFLLKPAPISRDAKLSIVLAAVWAYCLLVGWQAPVVRASFMATLFIAARISGRKADALNTLGFAALGVLLWRPRELFDVGFQLSFLAVWGLILFMPSFAPPPAVPAPGTRGKPRLAAAPTAFQRATRYASELFWVSLVAVFTSLPLTAWNFYLVTPLSIFANMAVVPLSFLLFFTGLFFFLFAGLPQALFVPAVMKALMAAFLSSLYFFEELPGAAVIVGRPEWALLVLLSAGTAWIFLSRRFRSRPVRAACLFLFALDVFLAQEALRHLGPRELTLTVLDVGQGDALVLEFPGGGTVVVDAGKGLDGDRGRRVVAPFLKSKGIRAIDAVVMSHSDEDHAGGLPAVFDEFRVKHYFSGADDGSRLYSLLAETAAKQSVPRGWLKDGDRIEGFRGVELDVLNPSAEYPAFLKNDNSIVLRAVYGSTAFLLTGDIGAAAMERLTASHAPLRADVLKVPHHGARMAEEGKAFVLAVAPRYAAISESRNNAFGHPAPATLSILRAAGAEILRTDERGALRFDSDGRSVKAVPFAGNAGSGAPLEP